MEDVFSGNFQEIYSRNRIGIYCVISFNSSNRNILYLCFTSFKGGLFRGDRH